MNSKTGTAVLLLLYTALTSADTLTYDDLETMGVSCPSKDKCKGYRNNLSYMDRSCECDELCSAYNDCCIDASSRTSTTSHSLFRRNEKCINYGEDPQTGFYAISRCPSEWSGSIQVQQKCVGPSDMRDPVAAAPVTDVGTNRTYKNLYCAECNNANMTALKTFHFRINCGSLDLPEEQLLADMFYNRRQRSWGVRRINFYGNETDFFACEIVFDVPEYLNNSIRFCRSNLISTCVPGWNRPVVEEACAAYMAVVVYDNTTAYRNAHCAICNSKTVAQVSCLAGITGRKRPMSFALLLDVNQSDGDQVGMRRVATPECPSGHKYDPFFKRCRQLVCALPGHVIVNGRCVNG